MLLIEDCVNTIKIIEYGTEYFHKRGRTRNATTVAVTGRKGFQILVEDFELVK